MIRKPERLAEMGSEISSNHFSASNEPEQEGIGHGHGDQDEDGML